MTASTSGGGDTVAFHYVLTVRTRYGDVASADGIAYLDPAVTSRSRFFKELCERLTQEMGVGRLAVTFFDMQRDAL
ncbi:hypothetical protein [Streptomyces sp. SID13726]|uniref:hypothetical protein n=1 Tax=Streptomyces sp. SID13726 TaxID=2706058 RepID=UPI0013BBBD20|nr:hypothetical protein [Streptomyces sp. SID13726]NEB04335.1 hypothetical protein [Streptomyces sp. SID13726]